MYRSTIFMLPVHCASKYIVITRGYPNQRFGFSDIVNTTPIIDSPLRFKLCYSLRSILIDAALVQLCTKMY